ncbi:hypothetical protein ACLOJK_029295 [Asimina triloba]
MESASKESLVAALWSIFKVGHNDNKMSTDVSNLRSAKHSTAMNKLQLHLMICFLAPLRTTAACYYEPESADHDRIEALQFKLIAIASILVAAGMTQCLCLSLGELFPRFIQTDTFAAGVIIATAMIHILPDVLESLGSPCLKQDP